MLEAPKVVPSGSDQHPSPLPTPEALARESIDRALTDAGWVVQDMAALNLGAGRGVAVREFPV